MKYFTPGSGIASLGGSIKPRIQRRIDVIVRVEEAIEHHDIDALQKLLLECWDCVTKNNTWAYTISRIQEEIEA